MYLIHIFFFQISLKWETHPQTVLILTKPNSNSVRILCAEMVRCGSYPLSLLKSDLIIYLNKLLWYVLPQSTISSGRGLIQVVSFKVVLLLEKMHRCMLLSSLSSFVLMKRLFLNCICVPSHSTYYI